MFAVGMLRDIQKSARPCDASISAAVAASVNQTGTAEGSGSGTAPRVEPSSNAEMPVPIADRVCRRVLNQYDALGMHLDICEGMG